jgi:hypothetical protein
MGYFETLRFFIKDFLMIFLDKYPPYNEFCDHYLLPDESWQKPLEQLGIKKSQLVVTGNLVMVNVKLQN